jgi:hypothetical protein
MSDFEWELSEKTLDRIRNRKKKQQPERPQAQQAKQREAKKQPPRPGSK